MQLGLPDPCCTSWGLPAPGPFAGDGLTRRRWPSRIPYVAVIVLVRTVIACRHFFLGGRIVPWHTALVHRDLASRVDYVDRPLSAEPLDRVLSVLLWHVRCVETDPRRGARLADALSALCKHDHERPVQRTRGSNNSHTVPVHVSFKHPSEPLVSQSPLDRCRMPEENASEHMNREEIRPLGACQLGVDAIEVGRCAGWRSSISDYVRECTSRPGTWPRAKTRPGSS